MIQSHLIQHVIEGVQLLFYDTVFNGKHVFTACGVGRVRNNDAEITPVAQKTLMALSSYVENAHGSSMALRLQEIATLQAVPVRIHKALESANDKEIVFFVCRDHHIYDAAVAGLSVQWVGHASVQ